MKDPPALIRELLKEITRLDQKMSIDEEHKSCIEFVIPCREPKEISRISLGIELRLAGLQRGIRQ